MTFHGGVDEQYLLSRGTPEQVRDEVRRLIEIMITREQGNHIVCAADAIQLDTPVENIMVMHDTALGCS